PRADLSAFPPKTQAAALLVVLDVRLQGDHPSETAVVADKLVGVARGPDDVYQSARAYAVCVAKVPPKAGSGRQLYAAQALKYLDRAIQDGFRDVSQLESKAWDVVRDEPEFKRLLKTARKLPAIAPAPRVAAGKSSE